MTTDAEWVGERIKEARLARTPLRIVGGGSWLDAGAPCSALDRLELGKVSGIVEYEPGDLTLKARAGTSLAEISLTTASEGQWLALDPPGEEGSTLGAVVATGSWGPLAHAFGTPRDQLLGLEFVTGTGDIVRAGGRVVKNVAGFDLVRLVTGAWGTLGAITEVTVRLRSRPETEVTMAVGLDGGNADVERASRWLRYSEYTPLAAELLSPSLARKLSAGTSTTLLVRLGGNAANLRAAEESVYALGDAALVDPQCWKLLSHVEPGSSTVMRLSTLPSTTATLWSSAASLAEGCGGFAHATLGRGVIRCVVPTVATEAVGKLVSLASQAMVTCIGERMPAGMWETLRQRNSTTALSARVRVAFDPDGILNPGIMAVSS